MGTVTSRTRNPRPRSASTAITPPAASRPNADPPERTIASTALDRHLRLQQGGIADAGSAAENRHRRDGRPLEQRDGDAGGARGVVGIADKEAGNVGDQVEHVRSVGEGRRRARRASARAGGQHADGLPLAGRRVFLARQAHARGRQARTWCARRRDRGERARDRASLGTPGRTGYKQPMSDVSLTAAVFAGILSFLSPCVLPLVPPYLCFLAGTTIEEFAEGGERRAKRDIMLVAVLFVLGFSTVFVTLGATASVLGQVIRQYLDTLSLLAGAAIIVMGLHFLGVFRLRSLSRSADQRGKARRAVGRLCHGPRVRIRLDALHRADPGRDPRGGGSEDTAARGAMLLAAYSRRARYSFLLAALALEPFTGSCGVSASRWAMSRRRWARSWCDGRRLPDRLVHAAFVLAAGDIPGARAARLERRPARFKKCAAPSWLTA